MAFCKKGALAINIPWVLGSEMMIKQKSMQSVSSGQCNANNARGILQRRSEKENKPLMSVHKDDNSTSMFDRKKHSSLFRDVHTHNILPKQDMAIEDIKGKMENSFGHDFSNVKIHTNSERAEEVGAIAFTQGEHIHFAHGQFNPVSRSGQELLGHEYAHVVQQRQGRVKATVQAENFHLNEDISLENEANKLGKLAANSYQTKTVKNKSYLNGNTGSSQLNGINQPIQRVPQVAAAGLWGIAGLEAVEAATLGLTAIPLVQSVFNVSGKRQYSSAKVSRLMAKEPKPFSRRYKPNVIYTNVAALVNPAKATFELIVDSNDYGEIVAYVRIYLAGSDSFSKSSINASFKNLGLYPKKGGEKDPRAWPIRFSYEGNYDAYANGEWDFQGEFIFNAFGMLKNIEHKVISRSSIEWMVPGPYVAVRKSPDRNLSYTKPKLLEPQKKILMQNYKKDPNYKPPKTGRSQLPIPFQPQSTIFDE
jgi:hypothetical protein